MKDKNSWGLLQVSDWSLGSDFAPVDLKHHLLQSSYSCSITLRGDVIHLSCCTPRVTPELVSLSLQILLSAAGLWWMFCAVNWSLSLSPPPPRPSLPPSASVSEDGKAALQSDSSHSGGEGGGQEQPLALLWLLPFVSVCLSSLLWRRRWLLAGFVQPFERLHSFSPSLFFCFYLLLHPVTFDPKLDLPYPPPPTPRSQGWQKVTSPSSTLHWTQTGRWGLTVMKWCHFWHHHPLSRHEQPQHGSESPKTVFVFLMMFVSNCKHPGPQTANQRPLSVCVCFNFLWCIGGYGRTRFIIF